MTSMQTGMHYPIDLAVLPVGWEKGCVGDFALEIQPGFASGKHNKEGRGIPHIRPYNIDRSGKLDLSEIKSVDPKADTKRLHSGDVLFNNTNSPELIGKTTVITATDDWGFSNHMTRVAFPDAVSPKFAAYQLHYLWSRGYFLHNCVKHVNQASVSSTTLARTVPFVKPPRSQQDSIVAEIEKQFSRLDEAVANLKRVKANLKRYKASILKAAVEGKLTEDWRKQHPNVEPASKLLERVLDERRMNFGGKGNYKEPTAPDTSSLPDLPDRWVWATMPQLGELNRGKSKHRPRNDPKLFGGPYPFIQTGDVKHSGGFVRAHSQTYNESGLAQSRLWPAGTLCITIAANIAETGILTYPACFPDSVVGFVFDSAPVTVRFIDLFFRTEREEIARFAPATAQKNINLEILSEVAVPLPPLEEQKGIVTEVERRLSVIDALEATVEANLTRADRLRQSILGDAFSGKLVRVTV